MNKNFILADAVAFQTGNEYFDVHNCFDLAAVAINLVNREVELKFMCRNSVCFDAAEKTLVINFSNVDYLDISPGVFKCMVRDVAELGYKNPGDFDHDWLICENKMSKADHFFLRLVEDEFIRIHAESALLTLQSC